MEGINVPLLLISLRSSLPLWAGLTHVFLWETKRKANITFNHKYRFYLLLLTEKSFLCLSKAAGGLPSGMPIKECLVKECAEEASIPECIARRAVPAGAIRYSF